MAAGKKANAEAATSKTRLKKPRANANRRRKKTANHIQNDSPFSFLELPGEVRNMIYEFTLVDDEETVTIESNDHRATRRLMKHGDFEMLYGIEEANQIAARKEFRSAPHYRWNKPLCGQLLRVNKQINQEATTILYAKNHFAFLEPLAMRVFLRQIQQHIQEVRHCSLLTYGHHHATLSHDEFKELIEAVNLRSLVLEMSCIYSLHQYSQARHGNSACNIFYNAAHRWLWTLAVREGNKDAMLKYLFVAQSRDGYSEGREKHRLQVFRKWPRTFDSRMNLYKEEAGKFISNVREIMD